MIVDRVGVIPEDGVLSGAGGVLQLEDGLGVKQVVLAFAAPLVLAAEIEVRWACSSGRGRKALRWRAANIGGDLFEVDSTERCDGAVEVLVQKLLGTGRWHRPTGRPGRTQRGNAHLGHDLEHAGTAAARE